MRAVKTASMFPASSCSIRPAAQSLALVPAADDLSDFGQMLAGMVEVDDLYSAGKVFLRNIPDPYRAISQNNNALSPFQSPAHGFGVDARTKFLSRFDRSDIGGGLVIALRPALILRR